MNQLLFNVDNINRLSEELQGWGHSSFIYEMKIPSLGKSHFTSTALSFPYVKWSVFLKYLPGLVFYTLCREQVVTPKMCIHFYSLFHHLQPAPSPWARKCLGWAYRIFRKGPALWHSAFCLRQPESDPTPAFTAGGNMKISAGEEVFYASVNH